MRVNVIWAKNLAGFRVAAQTMNAFLPNNKLPLDSERSLYKKNTPYLGDYSLKSTAWQAKKNEIIIGWILSNLDPPDVTPIPMGLVVTARTKEH